MRNFTMKKSSAWLFFGFLGAFSMLLAVERKPDLRVNVEGPASASRGTDISYEIKVLIGNWGTERVGRFVVELVLSSDTRIPMAPGTYSPNYREDVLLEGGHIVVDALAPTGQSYQDLSLFGPIKLPADTPPGTYYLGAVIDPNDRERESDERNNTALCRLDVTCRQPLGVADCTLWFDRAIQPGNKLNISWVLGNSNMEVISFQGELPTRFWVQNVENKDSSGRWVKVLENPLEVVPATAPTIGFEAPVSLTNDYRVVFKAQYPCDRMKLYTLEKPIGMPK